MASPQNLDVEKLIRVHDEPCVSVYLPASDPPMDSREPSIRMKNAIGECKKQLGDRGLESEVIKKLLEPIRAFSDEKRLFTQTNKELAIFSSRNLFQYHQLAIEYPQQTYVAERFYVKPLVPLLTFDEKFYILSLSLHQIKLCEATRQGLREISMKDSPVSINDLLQYEQAQEQIQLHTMPKGKSAGSSAMFHGHGNISDESTYKKDIAEFLNEVDKGLMGSLSNHKSPLVLAGVDNIRAAYANLSDYPNILPEGIDGNPEQLKESESHKAAWNIMEPLLAKEIQRSMERYGDLSSSGRTSTNLGEILSAAYQGRVDTLFVDEERCVWGTFNPQTDRIHIHRESEKTDEELLNLAVIQTLLGRGKVYTPSVEQMPREAAQAAIFRY
jgi:hypothetical protein